MARLFITADEVAELCEFDGYAQFMARRRVLEDEHGFPRPVPLMDRPLKWRRSDVEAWLDGIRMLAPPQLVALNTDDRSQQARRTVLLHQAGRP